MSTPRKTGKARGRPRTGAPLSAAERMRRYRSRQRAAGLKAVARWEPHEALQTAGHFSSHRVLDARSLAMHCRIAQKLMADPAVMDIARQNLGAWRRKAAGREPLYLQEWAHILSRPPLEVAALITEQSENATRLRQSSPFAGVLSATERRRIYDAFRA
ncbi:MAG: hypothetical protein OEW88_05065 [Gammaproteobacteria bacterium]|nr:hypothetical protein [Gammaproteobacteria bacterium]